MIMEMTKHNDQIYCLHSKHNINIWENFFRGNRYYYELWGKKTQLASPFNPCSNTPLGIWELMRGSTIGKSSLVNVGTPLGKCERMIGKVGTRTPLGTSEHGWPY